MISPRKNKLIIGCITGAFFQNTQNELVKIGQFFQVAIHFHPCYPQPKMDDTSFCGLVGL